MAGYISRTLTANNQKLLTISLWVKLAKIQEQDLVTSYYSGSYWGSLRFASNGRLSFQDYRNSYLLNLKTNAQYRDTNAWYHIVANFDCSIGSPTAKLYVNGEEPSLQTSTIYSQNATTSWNTDYTFRIGEGSTLGGSDFEGVMSDVYFIQGYKYDASTFGETDATTGEWKPKLDPTINYGGTGGNSCHLLFENAGNLDLDSGSNSVSFTTSGTLTQTKDCPSNNFATLNPLNVQSTGYTIANGNLSITGNTGGAFRTMYGTLGASSGKFYWEMKVTGTNGSDPMNMRFGIVDSDQMDQTNGTFHNETRGYAYTGNSGNIQNGSSNTAYGNTYTTNDIIGCAVDLDNSKLYFSKNGTWQNSGDPTSGSTGTGAAATIASGYTYLPAMESYYNQDTYTYNFGNGFFGTTAISSEGTNASGNGKFEYDVPAGYTALSTKGLNT